MSTSCGLCVYQGVDLGEIHLTLSEAVALSMSYHIHLFTSIIYVFVYCQHATTRLPVS